VVVLPECAIEKAEEQVRFLASVDGVSARVPLVRPTLVWPLWTFKIEVAV
jgi:hypothetical protein